MSVQILAVVIRYETPLADSPTVASLARAFAETPALLGSVQVLVWDNGPEPDDPSGLPFPVLYRHAAANAGIAGACNGALAVAEQRGIPWLLPLDQDTTLPPAFLTGMLANADALASRERIAAIVPDVFVGRHRMSPWRVLFNRHEPYPEGEAGIAPGEPAAVNSGSLLRVSALRAIGGYSEAFWLDYSDWYVYHQFFRKGLEVWRAAEVRVEHSMTVMDYDNLMSEWRYRNFLVAESAFNDLYKGRRENAVQTLRLLVRGLRQRQRFRNPLFSRLTWRHWVTRMVTTRGMRVRRWERLSSGRQGRPA